ncbi:MAG: hypothetical protein WAM71_07695 [Candidatus Korobacteraceae bacterium]
MAAVIVFACPALWEFLRGSSLTSITGADFWWHLQTGLEILRTHSLPHTGWFSQSAAQPWIASSWLYDVRIAGWYQLLGIRFLPVLALLAKFFLAVLMFLLAGGLRGRFWAALALSVIAQCLLWQMPPLPVFCSVLALAIELILLLELRSRGSRWAFLSLPALFLAWANLDSHFVYGILILLLFVAAWLAEEKLSATASRKSKEKRMPGILLLAIAAASIVATCITPYGWQPWATFWSNTTSAANVYFPDYLSLRFRGPQDYVLLLLAMAAFLTLGMRRSRDLFQIALLVLCTVTAFHAQRDAWLLVLAAVAVIANPAPEEAASCERRPASGESRATFLVAAGVSLVLLLAVVVTRMPRRDAVMAKVAESYPVAAADYIRQHQLPGPLFNSFPWGGFLTWYLPEYPAALDGRTDLYGPDFNVHYAKVMNFGEHYSTFPPLNEAGVILLEKNSHMAIALASVPTFKTVYSDNVAVVLVREQGQP